MNVTGEENLILFVLSQTKKICIMSKKSNGWGAFWFGFALFTLLPKALAKGDKMAERNIAGAMILIFVLIPLALGIWLKD